MGKVKFTVNTPNGQTTKEHVAYIAGCTVLSAGLRIVPRDQCEEFFQVDIPYDLLMHMLTAIRACKQMTPASPDDPFAPGSECSSS